MNPGRRPLSDGAREQIIRDHVDAENRRDIAAAVASFKRPRCEFVSTGEVVDGRAALEAMYGELFAAVPDLTVTVSTIDHRVGSSIARTEMRGTDAGGYRGSEPTGRQLRIHVLSQYVFDDGGLVCQRVYALDEGPDPDGYLTRLGNTVSLSAARRHRRKSRP